MKYHFIEHIDPSLHDEFIQAQPICNLLQSSSWAKVKDNWGHAIVGVEENDALVASALVLIKRLPLGFTMLYIPRGPIMDYENKSLVIFFMKQLKVWAKKHKCVFIKFDPGIQKNQYKVSQRNETTLKETETALCNLREAGCIHQGFTTGFNDTIQPRFHAVVKQCDNFEQSLSKAVKKALQTVEKKKIKISSYQEEGIEEFAKVMLLTQERKNIHLRDQSYFRTLLQIYGDDAIIYLATLPIKELLDECKEKLISNEEALHHCPENAKKKRFTLEEQHASLQREVTELEEYYKLFGYKVTISGALCIRFGDTSELLYAGMDDRFKRYMAPYASFYACMLWSFEQGCTQCNMGGVEGSLTDGLTKFKANFNPYIYEYVGEFDLPVQPLLYKPFIYLYKKRKGASN